MKRSCTVTWALYRLERWNARWHLHTTSYIYSSCACVIQTRCLLFSSLFGWWYYCTSTRRICLRIFFFPIQIKSFPSNTEIDCLQQQPFFFGGGGCFLFKHLQPWASFVTHLLHLVSCILFASCWGGHGPVITSQCLNMLSSHQTYLFFFPLDIVWGASRKEM